METAGCGTVISSTVVWAWLCESRGGVGRLLQIPGPARRSVFHDDTAPDQSRRGGVLPLSTADLHGSRCRLHGRV